MLISLLTRQMSHLPVTDLSLGSGLPVGQLETLFPPGRLSDLGRGLVMGQLNYLGCLLSTALWSFYSPLTKVNPLCLTRYMPDDVKSMKVYSGRGGWRVLEPLSYLQSRKSSGLGESWASIQFISCCLFEALFRVR